VPRSRLERREPAISRVGTRTTRSPRAIKNRSNEPETCRQSSSAHTRSRPRPRAHCSAWSKPRTPTLTVLSPIISPVVAAIPAIVCERLCMSAPGTIISSRPLLLGLKWTAGGHGLLRALPRSYQGHAGHP